MERSTCELVLGPPKSEAGKRIVGVPQAITPVLKEHLRLYVKPDPGALVFTGIKGGPMRRSGLNKLSGWMEAVRGDRRPRSALP